jgi:hypothetical protein
VIATGKAHSVRECCEVAFDEAGWATSTVRDDRPAFVRPAEVDHLIGDPGKAERDLGWKPQTSFEELIRLMRSERSLKTRRSGWTSGFRRCGSRPTPRTASRHTSWAARSASRRSQRGSCCIASGSPCRCSRSIIGMARSRSDETFIGGKARNMHKSKRDAPGRSLAPAARTRPWSSWRLLQRGGHVRAEIVSGARTKQGPCTAHVRKHVAELAQRFTPTRTCRYTRAWRSDFDHQPPSTTPSEYVRRPRSYERA